MTLRSRTRFLRRVWRRDGVVRLWQHEGGKANGSGSGSGSGAGAGSDWVISSELEGHDGWVRACTFGPALAAVRSAPPASSLGALGSLEPAHTTRLQCCQCAHPRHRLSRCHRDCSWLTGRPRESDSGSRERPLPLFSLCSPLFSLAGAAGLRRRRWHHPRLEHPERQLRGHPERSRRAGQRRGLRGSRGSGAASRVGVRRHHAPAVGASRRQCAARAAKHTCHTNTRRHTCLQTACPSSRCHVEPQSNTLLLFRRVRDAERWL